MRFRLVGVFAMLSLVSGGTPGEAAPPVTVRSADGMANASSVRFVADRTPLPRAHPRPRGQAAEAPVASISGVEVIGGVENDPAVPLGPSAFAERADTGPIGDLFRAAETQAADGADAAALLRALSGNAPTSGTDPLAMFAPDAGPTVTSASAFDAYGRQPGSLKAALEALRRDRYDEVLRRRNGLADPVERMLVDYLLIRSGSSKVSSAMVADYAARAATWPSNELVRVRAEEALSREAPRPAEVVRAMGGVAVSPVGTRLLAKALIAQGDVATAMRLVRAVWHEKSFGTGLQSAYTADFSAHLSIDDHLTRIDRLVAGNDFEEAKALRGRLGTGPRAYVDARIAVATAKDNALALMALVPDDLKRRSGYHLAEIEAKRRSNDIDGAARLIERAPAGGHVDGDAWWVETRIVARMLAEQGEGRRAYALVSRGFAAGRTQKADEAFHAGWFALRYLRDGQAADRHFADIERVATTPLSLSRAAYWRGRAAALLHDTAAIRAHYSDAARFGYTYYGQLARAELGLSGTGVAHTLVATDADRSAFARNEVAEGVRRLIAAGHGHRIYPLLQHLAETVETPGQMALAAALARDAGYPHLALMVAKDAQRRGLDVAGLAYPTEGIPRSAAIPAGLDRALVYAIARQESSFNPAAVSPVGARGLMQVMPDTAAAMARELRLRHTAAKLTSDPAYNATLGAAYLEKRLADFDGSYILTFAAYNAGAGRVREWIARFGDPRDPGVDPVTWVEDIPYPETRNYVQRVMENVQVYREALGTGRLAILSDLSRGSAG